VASIVKHGPVAQLGERHNGIVEVKGSSPFRSTQHATKQGGTTENSFVPRRMKGFFVSNTLFTPHSCNTRVDRVV
jgi:hypothetical protein